MNQKKTLAIVLSRVDYGEADRILTVLTPYEGKLSLMAKGARKVRSKLAGGIELFSENELTYIPGRGEVGTLVSSRLLAHYPKVLANIERTMLGYELIKMLHKATEQQAEEVYYGVLKHAFEALNDEEVPPKVLQLWFVARMLALGGHSPNLASERDGAKLQVGTQYGFDFDAMCMTTQTDGAFGEREIKFLRLLFTRTHPGPLKGIDGHEALVATCQPLVTSLKTLYMQ